MKSLSETVLYQVYNIIGGDAAFTRCVDCDFVCESTNIIKEEYNGYHSTKKETKDSKR